MGLSSEGSCVVGFANAEVTGGLLLSLGLTLFYGFLSMWAADKEEAASTPQMATVWQLLSASFSYAIGWGFFNTLRIPLDCLPGDMYYYVGTQVSNAATLTALSLFNYFCIVPFIERKKPIRRTDKLVRIFKDIR
jgi:hypothetical protein